MNEVFTILLSSGFSYFTFEFVLEDRFKMRQKLKGKVGNLNTRLIGILITTLIIYTMMPYRGDSTGYNVMFGFVFGFLYYSVVPELRSFIVNTDNKK